VPNSDNKSSQYLAGLVEELDLKQRISAKGSQNKWFSKLCPFVGHPDVLRILFVLMKDHTD
jgi:hypothetical protein